MSGRCVMRGSRVAAGRRVGGADDRFEVLGGLRPPRGPSRSLRRSARPRRPASPHGARSAARPAHAPRPARGTSPCGTRSPVRSCTTDSRSPGESLAMVGVPQAAASRFVIPHPSLGEGKTFAQLRPEELALTLLASRSRRTPPRSPVPSRPASARSSLSYSPRPPTTSRASASPARGAGPAPAGPGPPPCSASAGPGRGRSAPASRVRSAAGAKKSRSTPGWITRRSSARSPRATRSSRRAARDRLGGHAAVDRAQRPLQQPGHRGERERGLAEGGGPEQVVHQEHHGRRAPERGEDRHLVERLHHHVEPLRAGGGGSTRGATAPKV